MFLVAGQTKELVAGGLCWILSLEFFVGQAVAQVAWTGALIEARWPSTTEAASLVEKGWVNSRTRLFDQSATRMLPEKAIPVGLSTAVEFVPGVRRRELLAIDRDGRMVCAIQDGVSRGSSSPSSSMGRAMSSTRFSSP